MHIGVPRALSFYYLFPLYRSFLTRLGISFTETPGSTVRDLDRLRLCPTDEPCISVKIAFSHAAALLAGKADALFVPAVVSLEPDNYCCPKMMGLPSMLKAGLELDDSRIISPVIDVKDHPCTWESSWIDAGRKMGVTDADRIRKALREALSAWRQAEQDMHRLGIPLGRLLDGRKPEGQERDWFRSATWGTYPRRSSVRPPLTGLLGATEGPTAVMGHAYLLNDLFGRTIIRYVSSAARWSCPR